MRSKSWLCVALAALMVGAGAGAAEPHIGKFVKYDTGDFVIVTSRSATQARQFMQGLAKFRLTLERLLGRRAAKSGIGTRIVIVSESDWNKYLQPREQIAGFFQRSRFNNYMALNGDAGDFSLYTMFHEYTHFYLASQFAGEYPPWFNEGLAELMAYARFDKKNRVVLLIPPFHVDEARDRDWIPFERLIKVNHSSPEYQSHKLNGSFYAQAWLTVHYGMIENRDFGRQFTTYLRDLNMLMPQAEAIQKNFGDDLGLIDQKLHAVRTLPHPFGQSRARRSARSDIAGGAAAEPRGSPRSPHRRHAGGARRSRSHPTAGRVAQATGPQRRAYARSRRASRRLRRRREGIQQLPSSGPAARWPPTTGKHVASSEPCCCRARWATRE
jgi:hypothetical protein